MRKNEYEEEAIAATKARAQALRFLAMELEKATRDGDDKTAHRNAIAILANTGKKGLKESDADQMGLFDGSDLK